MVGRGVRGVQALRLCTLVCALEGCVFVVWILQVALIMWIFFCLIIFCWSCLVHIFVRGSACSAFPSSPTYPSLFLPSSKWVLVHLQCAVFPNSPAQSSLFLPSSEWVLICDVLHFQAYQPAPPSSSPLASKFLFATCHTSKLTNPLLPLSPLQQVLVSSGKRKFP